MENLPTIEDLRAERAALRQAVAFFASVIKSGEAWTDICEQTYRRVMVDRAPKEQKHSPLDLSKAEHDGT